MRKMISVDELRALVNDQNRFSICPREMRDGWNSLLEQILYDTGNYRGYTHLSRGCVPAGEKPGVILGETPRENVFPDDSRRRYF